MESMAKAGPSIISDMRYNRALQNITLLRVMGEIDNKEVRRIISLLRSPDHENWFIAERILDEQLQIK